MFLNIFFIVLITFSLISYSESAKSVAKAYNGEVFVHIMPWFETRETSGTGQWGIHWTMANQNPDIIGENGRRQIAAHYYPEIGPYGSGDESVIEYQLNLMKYAGIDGIFIDWPGTVNAWDYPKNLENSNNIIRVAERIGLKFAIVYEDHNIGMAADAGFIGDKIGAAKNDMSYMRDNYFNKGNYVHVNGGPLLLIFGPQTFQQPSEWSDIFSVLPQKPTFMTLWYESQEAEGSAAGEYCWIYSDFLAGLRNFYENRPLNFKIGGAYPGFNTFYAQGGWPGPDWGIPVGPDTFRQTLDLALNGNVPMIQLNTWNDYGEGTIIEPTVEFGNQYLTILQEKLGVKYTESELLLIKNLYLKRKEFAKDGEKQKLLNQVAEALANLQPDVAKDLLNNL